MKLFGLTGGIASGKSTVCRWLVDAGIPVVDSDQVSREVVQPGSEGLAEIAQTFGAELIRADGSLDREALGRRIFPDAEARQKLNAILHPRIQALSAEKTLAFAQSGAPFVVLDIPLLFEVRDPKSFDAVIVVYVDADTQLQRLMARNSLSEAEARSRIASQMPLEEKRTRADKVIDNRGSLDETRAQTEALIDWMKGFSASE